VKSLLAACQGALLGVIAVRLVESTAWRYVLLVALAFPIAAMLMSHLLPRLAASIGLLLILLWTATCGYAAYVDPFLEAWLWIPVFALGGLLFGSAANSVFFVNANAFDMRHAAASNAAPPERDRRGQSSGTEAPSPSSPPLAEPDPWTVLQVAPTASANELARAFRARMAEYHPDKVATMGPEIRALAEQKAKTISLAYARARQARS
jgi:hypothetical protein